MRSSPATDRRPARGLAPQPILADHQPTERPGSARLAAWLLAPLAVVLVALLALFYVVFDYSSVDGPSMLPNLLAVDGLLTTKGYDHPKRGDIVVLEIVGQDGRPDQIVKRVIGLPGDEVLVRNDVAFVNGTRERGYRILVDAPGHGDDLGPVRVPARSIYVMGDNRPVSYDSRYIGPQPLSAVSGRVVGIYKPVNRIGRIAVAP